MHEQASGRTTGAPLSRQIGYGLAGLIFLSALLLRGWAGRGLPLWFDESWTGMIVTQAHWSDFWREVWLDCNPPFYYLVMTLWTRIAGASDIALRLPGLIFTTTAALLPLFWALPGLRRRAAIVWAVLIYLWYPGFEISVEARCYGLLLLLSVGQLIAFVRLITTPTQRAAWIWAGLAGLAGLTHYHALLIAGLQGIALLIWHREKAMRLWPAAFAFAPIFGWLAIHAPRLADYARPDVAWYEPMTAKLAAAFVRYAMGGISPTHGLALIAVPAGSFIVARAFGASGSADASSFSPLRPLLLGVALCFVALGLELTLAVARPMLTDRYLVPLVPGILLALVLVVDRWDWKGTGLVALVATFLLPLTPKTVRLHLEDRTGYGFHRGSEFLIAQHIKKLVFACDHPSSRILDSGSMAKLGGFFLARSGQAVPVTVVVLRPGDNGNLLLQRAAGKDSAVLWIYNRARFSSARYAPPEMWLWQNRDCRWEHGPWVGTLACGPVRD